MLAAEALTQEQAQEIAAGWSAWLANGGTLDMGGEDDTALAPLVVEAERTPAKLARMNARVDAHTAEALALAGIAVTPDTLPLLRHAVGLAALHAYAQGPISGLRIVNPIRSRSAERAASSAKLPKTCPSLSKDHDSAAMEPPPPVLVSSSAWPWMRSPLR